MDPIDLILFGLVGAGGYLYIHHSAAAATTTPTTAGTAGSDVTGLINSGLGSTGTIASTLGGLFGGAEKSGATDGTPSSIAKPTDSTPTYDTSDPSDPYLDPNWGDADSGTSDDNSYLDAGSGW